MAVMQNKPNCHIFSIDVEEWFHILEVNSSPNFQNWNSLEKRLEKNLESLLTLLKEHGTSATFFTLGWVAEHYPELLKKAAEAGHEIASHGYSHRLIYSQSRQEFAEDICRAKELIEKVTGQRVIGYRAPGFSVTDRTPWAFDEIRRAGYLYDSSVFPGGHGHGGMRGSPLGPHLVETKSGNLYEFPITLVDFAGKKVCFFGGGYLRLFPYPVIRKMSHKVEKEQRPVVYYIHPREVDPGHPRLPMGIFRAFKSYVNLRSTLPKLGRILTDFHTVSFRDYLGMSASHA